MAPKLPIWAEREIAQLIDIVKYSERTWITKKGRAVPYKQGVGVRNHLRQPGNCGKQRTPKDCPFGVLCFCGTWAHLVHTTHGSKRISAGNR